LTLPWFGLNLEYLTSFAGLYQEVDMAGRIFISAMLVVLIAFPIAAYAHGEEKHGDKAPGEEMSAKDMEMDTVTAADAGDDFIRYDAPTGMSVVLGRQNPLKVLEPEIIKEDGKRIKVFKLTVKDFEFEVYLGKKVQAFAFNGSVPGPVIRVTEGDRIRIILTSDSKDEHTIHIHGQPKPLEMDGVPYLSQMPVKKGESYTYEFKVTNSGTHWYHCHVDSGHHVDMGMYGAFIVDPKKEKLKFDREYTLILDEWPGGHVHGHDGGAAMEGHGGETNSMMTDPTAEPPRKDTMTGMDITEKSGKTMDEAMALMPAVEPDTAMPGMKKSATAMTAPAMAHMAKPVDREWYPKTYKPHTPVYDTFTINGRAFPNTQPLEVREGERVRIRLINVGHESHFMHSHSHRFEIVAKDGNPVPGKPQVRDTVEVGPGSRVDIILTADNPGVWPFHCHNLLHVANDNIYPGGMLTFITYTEDSP
jgi:FtsP/CotA-like multicopper oxidase with cupredoxin domain